MNDYKIAFKGTILIDKEQVIWKIMISDVRYKNTRFNFVIKHICENIMK